MSDYVEVCTEVKHGGRRERNYTYFTSKDLSEVTVNIPKKSTREIRVSHWEHNDLFNILIDGYLLESTLLKFKLFRSFMLIFFVLIFFDFSA